MKSDCIFCNIAKKETKEEIVMESKNFIALRDIHPRTPGHTLVIPKEHYVTLLDIPHNLGDELLEFTKEVAGSLLDSNYGTGVNIVMNNSKVAGQVVMHAHIHILPRKEGDGLRMVA
jgi:histidine triad (HIT) family protein